MVSLSMGSFTTIRFDNIIVNIVVKTWLFVKNTTNRLEGIWSKKKG